MNLNEQTYRIKQMMGLLEQTTSNITVEACQSLVPKKTFEEAKQWWINWLNNDNTQLRFAIVNNLKKREVKKYIDLYLKKLNELTLIYVVDENNLWVKEGNKVMGYVHDGKNTILVNCILIQQIKKSIESIKNTFIHEIAHALNEVKPLVPYDIVKDNMRLWGNNVQIKYPDEMLESLKNDGFDETVSNSLVKTFFSQYMKNPNYIVEYSLDVDEILARFEDLRAMLNKNSGEPITVKEINDLYLKGYSDKTLDISDLITFLFAIMISGVSLPYFLRSANQYTYNNQSNQPKVA